MVLRVAYELIKWYLCNIMQYVSYDGHIFGRLRISCGVPQGSILGPQLYKMYVNDMCNVMCRRYSCVFYLSTTVLRQTVIILVLIYFSFPVLKQMSELQLFQLLHRLCGTRSMLVLNMLFL